MRRLLLDTNIYGLLMADKNFHILHSGLEEKKEGLRIYGFDVIRKELKQAPRITIKGVNIQASLLRAYSSFTVKEYTLEKEFEKIADDYYEHYGRLGGSSPKKKLFNDFLIIACASVKNISIVVSEDNATMLNEIALKAYETVNKNRGIGFPEFIGYENFREMILRTGFSDPLIDNSNKLRVFLSFFNIFPRINFILDSFIFHRRLKENLIYKSFV